MCHSVLTDVAYVIRFNLIIFLQEIYIYVLQHIYTLSLFLTYLLTYLPRPRPPVTQTISVLQANCPNLAKATVLCDGGVLLFVCMFVCLFVCGL